jgi:SAM-dependent methyltransferase
MDSEIMNFNQKLLKNSHVVNRQELILQKCRNKFVLHLGAIDYFNNNICGFHDKILLTSKKVIGVDIDIEGLKKAHKEGYNNIFYCDVLNLNNNIFKYKNKFDIILAGEIIEHLDNPGLFLEQMKLLLNDKTELIISTPNAFCFHRFFYPFIGIERNHPNHLHIYSYTT